MSTTAHPSLHRPDRQSRRVLWLVLGVIAIATGAFVVDRAVFLSPRSAPAIKFIARPDLASDIDGLVIGSARTAPGVTAYVLGPRGAWLGAAGVANVKTSETIRPDARMRLESVSKLFTATLILQLEQQGKLHVTDTVQRWLPGLLRSYGSEITIRELLTNRSGLISDSDIGGSRTHALAQLAAVKDTRLRAKLLEIGTHAAADPMFPVDPIWPIRWAAWLPLMFAPGTGYHYSNIGYNILGLIAERATGKPLSVLYQHHIFGPLGLKHTAYDPNGPIQGPHSHGYRISKGTLTDTTDVHEAKGADGGIVSNAQDTGTFLVAVMRGRLLDRRELAGMKGANFWRSKHNDNGTVVNMCHTLAYGWAGEGEGYKTEAWTDATGTRVAVLLLNAVNPPFQDQVAFATASTLYCSA